MSEQKFIARMTGYKATNADMTCTPKDIVFKFEIGKWYEAEGEIALCGNGFHFCVHPSGPWSYYNAEGTRILKVEAEQVLDIPIEPGADFKLVAKRIRLVEEVLIGGDRNTGDRNTGNWNTGNWNTGRQNTGDRNTGDQNTGNRNTGDRNTGDRNTGDQNTGNRNTGNRNTGDQNTGNRNTGNWNTGNRNTGDQNTGNRNTGNWNTGDQNTGNWNTANLCTGMFCAEDPKVISFDTQTNLTREQFFDKYAEVYTLGELLFNPEPIDFKRFKNIPGITADKLSKLHAKHLAARGINKV